MIERMWKIECVECGSGVDLFRVRLDNDTVTQYCRECLEKEENKPKIDDEE